MPDWGGQEIFCAAVCCLKAVELFACRGECCSVIGRSFKHQFIVCFESGRFPCQFYVVIIRLFILAVIFQIRSKVFRFGRLFIQYIQFADCLNKIVSRIYDNGVAVGTYRCKIRGYSLVENHTVFIRTGVKCYFR